MAPHELLLGFRLPVEDGHAVSDTGGLYMRDPYKVLGVRKDAGADEIKAAWRNMAKVVHPDHNQSDPTASARFAEIGRAYETLKDPKKRSLFDTAARMAETRVNGETIMQQRQAAREAAMRAKAAQENAERVMEELARANAQKAAKAAADAARPQSAGPEAAEEMVERIFGAQAQAQAQAKSAAAASAASQAKTGKPTESDSAKPDGETAKSDSESAEAVAAANALLQPFSILTSLVRRFTGTAPLPEKAPDQFAQATVTIEDILKGNRISVQLAEGQETSFLLSPGTTEGQQIRLKGYGHKLPNMQRGDAVINIHIAADAKFSVHGYDLHTVLPVTIENAVLGTEARIEGPNGPVSVSVPAWSGSDRTIRVAGQGLPNDTGGRGDLVVELRIMLWEKPDDKVTDLMRSMREGLFL
jgi:DnaJ-class molecular chaperone